MNESEKRPVGPHTYRDYVPTMPILKWPCDELTKVAEEFDFQNDEYDVEFIAAELMSNLDASEAGVGLAATQLGIRRRVIAVKQYLGRRGRGQGIINTVLVNPLIEEYTKQVAHAEEGCLSLPGVYATVARPAGISVSYVDAVTREVHEFSCKGPLARVIQHEIDHLDGKMFFNRLDQDAANRVLRKYFSPEDAAVDVENKIAAQKEKRRRSKRRRR